MSKFFAGGFSSGEEEEQSTGSESEIENVPAARGPVRRALYMPDSDDEDDGKKRQVRSRKEARFDDMEKSIHSIKNHMKINDWIAIQQDFDNLQKAAAKAKNVISTQGNPDFYLRMLLKLEEFIKETNDNKEARKKMDKMKAKALTALKQKVSKHNKALDTELANFKKAHPNLSEAESAGSEDEGAKSDTDTDSDAAPAKPAPKSGPSAFLKKKGAAAESSSEEESESEEDEKPKAKKAKAPKAAGGEDSDDSMDWDNSDESDESESDEEQKGPRVRGPAYYLKTTVVEDEKKKEGRKKVVVKKDRKRKESDSDEDEDGDDQEGFRVTEVRRREIKLFDKDNEVSHEDALKKLTELVAMRGRKNLDRHEQVSVLLRLLDISEQNKLGPAMAVKILFSLLAARFDSVPSTATHMETQQWHNCIADFRRVVDLLNTHNIVAEPALVDDAEVFVVSEDKPRLMVQGDLVAFLERIDDELTRSLQNVDPHTTEYVGRLRDEQVFMEMAKLCRGYVEKNLVDSKFVCRVYIRVINHMYYKRDFVLKAIAKAAREAQKIEEPTPEELDPTGEMVKLCKYLYREDNAERMRTQAILCHIYHLALHDRWYEGRDLMLMSHLQESIQHADVPIQIQFNRTMVQLGFCAFRVGRIQEAHACLLEIYATNRSKELLAQGIMNQRHGEKKPEDEKMERRRQMPFHMHINLELLECVYLTCAMLLEVPNMASLPTDYKRRVISKPFRRLLDYSNRATFTGPPENTRDHVMAAARALMQGDWKKCCDLVLSLKIWALLTDHTRVKEMLIAKVQEEALRTYMFSFGGIYDTISLKELATMFDIPEARMHAILSKMMVNEELQASWDQPTASVVMHRNAELSHLQQLAVQFAEKGAHFVETNERVLDSRTGGYGYKENQQQRGPRQPGQQGWDPNRPRFQGPPGGRGGRGGRGGMRGGYRGRGRGGGNQY